MAKRGEEANSGHIYVVVTIASAMILGVVGLVFGFLMYRNFNAEVSSSFSFGSEPQFGSGSSPVSSPSSSASSDSGPPVIGARFDAGEASRTSVVERILPADQAPPDAPLKAHPDHPWVNLVRAESEKAGQRRYRLHFWDNGERIVVDFMSSANFATHIIMSHAKLIIMMKNERGEITEWHPPNIQGALEEIKDKGTWVLADGSSRFPGMMGGGTNPFTPNMEVFVVLEDRYDPDELDRRKRREKRITPKRFKISNSLSIGNKTGVTLAREWKADEVQKIEESVKTKTGLTPKEMRELSEATRKAENEAWGGKTMVRGERTQTTGVDDKHGHPFEFARVGKPTLGFAYQLGEERFHLESYIEKIRPVLTDVPVPGYERIMAKPGYAVGGVNVEATEHISGFQVIFMRLHGTGLNPGDSYTSDWIRASDKPPTIKGTHRTDVRLVIGIHGTETGSVCNSLGLILE